MEITVKNTKGEAVDTAHLSDALFAVPMNRAVVHQAMVMYQLNKRQGTHSTKTRAQVSGGGRKPWPWLGVGALGAMSHLSARSGLGLISPAAAQESVQWPEDMSNWLKEAGKPFAGQTVRLATESTPPSNAINSALKGYFTEMTGSMNL